MAGNIKKPGMQVCAEVRNGNVAEALKSVREQMQGQSGLETRSLRVKTEDGATYLFIRDKSVGLEFFNGGYKKRSEERKAAIGLLFENGSFKNKIYTTKKNEGNNGQSIEWTETDFVHQQGMVRLGDVGVDEPSDEETEKEEIQALTADVVNNLDSYTTSGNEGGIINTDELFSEEEGANTSPSSPNTPRAQQETPEPEVKNSSQTSATRKMPYLPSWTKIPEGNNPTTVPKLTLSRQATQSSATPVAITTPREKILKTRESQVNLVIPPENQISIAFEDWKKKGEKKKEDEFKAEVVNPLFDLLIKGYALGEEQTKLVKEKFDSLNQGLKNLIVHDQFNDLKNMIVGSIAEAVDYCKKNPQVTTHSPRKPVTRQNANQTGTVMKESKAPSNKVWEFAMNLRVQKKEKIKKNLATLVSKKASEKDEIDLSLNEAEAVVTLTVTAQKNNKKTEYPVSIQALSQDSFDVGSVDQKQPKSTRAPLIKRKATQNLNVKSSSDRIYYPIPTGTFEDDPEK